MLVIIGIVVLLFVGYKIFGSYASNRVDSQEREEAENHLPVTADKIERSLQLFFLTKRAKNMTGLLNDGMTISARTYILDNNYNSSDTFLAIRESLKKELKQDYIYLNTIKTKRSVTASDICEYMEFYNNDDCVLMLMVNSNDRYQKGHHVVIISLLKKPYDWGDN